MQELTRIRNVRGWSQQKLSDVAKVNKATINQIERGRRSPNVETLEKLAAALGVEIGDLFPKAQVPLPLEDGERASKETAEAQGSHRATYNAEALGRALASQWWEALEDLEETKANPAVYGAQLLALTVAAHRTRVAYEAAAQGGYAIRPEFRETLRLMGRAHSAVKAEAKVFLNGLTSEMAQRIARDFEEAFEREGAELDVR